MRAVTEGDRIAQLVLEKIATPEVEEVEVGLLLETGFDAYLLIYLLCGSRSRRRLVEQGALVQLARIDGAKN